MPHCVKLCLPEEQSRSHKTKFSILSYEVQKVLERCLSYNPRSGREEGKLHFCEMKCAVVVVDKIHQSVQPNLTFYIAVVTAY